MLTPRNPSLKIKLPLALLLAATPGLSQDFLAPLIVTASRFEQPARDVPHSAQRIDSAEIQQNQRRTLPETLQSTPGVLVQKTAHGHGSPFIRGFTGRQNLLLVDGVRINNSTFRSGPVQYWNTLDALAIDHIELIRSQGSVLYGSDAAGGTLNAFTKSSDFRARKFGESYTAGSASYEFRSSGQGSHVGRLETEAGVGGRFGVWLGISSKDFCDIEDSAIGRMKGTGYPEEDLDFRMDYAVSPESTVTLAHQYVNQDAISRWHRTLNNPGWQHDGHFAAPGLWTSNDYDQERSLSYLRYAGTQSDNTAFINRWSATLSYQTVADSEFQNRNPAEDSLRQSHIDLNTIGFDLTLESHAGPGTWVYGLDYYHDEVDSTGFRNNTAGTAFKESLPVADDSNYDLFGVFTQYQWKAGERLEITPGLRYTSAKASLGRFYDAAGVMQKDQSENWDSLVGSLRGLYRIDDGWSLFGGLSQAFRAPNLDDLSGNLTAKSGSTALGSVGLDAEEFLTYEIGARRQSETTSLEAAVFYTDVKNVILPVPTGLGASSLIATNASEGYIYGAELQGAWRFHPQWTLSGFAAWQDGRTESPAFLGGPTLDKPMTRLLPLTGSLALRWTSASSLYWIEGRLLAASEEDRITDQDQAADNQRIPTGGTPGYWVASLRAGWQPRENLSLTCGVENLTDEDYRNHGSGQNESGLQGIFGIRVSW
jgi:hemoglobin/transferrin/lactoferrin receptor protein